MDGTLVWGSVSMSTALIATLFSNPALREKPFFVVRGKLSPAET